MMHCAYFKKRPQRLQVEYFDNKVLFEIGTKGRRGLRSTSNSFYCENMFVKREGNIADREERGLLLILQFL